MKRVIKKIKGFTLVELIITMMLVIILSLVAMPLYRGRFSNQAKLAEGYALLGVIRDAQFKYYSEYGNFIAAPHGYGGDLYGKTKTTYDPVLNVSAASNKYFTSFSYYSNTDYGISSQYLKFYFKVWVYSAKAGTIEREFHIATHFEPIVHNGDTSFSI